MKKFLSVAVVCCLFFVSCSSFKRPTRNPIIQNIQISQEYHNTKPSFIPIDESLSFKSSFQWLNEQCLFFVFHDLDPYKFINHDPSLPLTIHGYGPESEDKSEYIFDIHAIQLANPSFKEDRYQVPQWRLPIAVIDGYFLHFMHTKDRSTEIWLSSMNMDQFVMVDTANILTELTDYEPMRVMFGQNNYYAYHDGYLAYRKGEDLVLVDMDDFSLTHELNPFSIPGAGKDLYTPTSYDLKAFFSMGSNLRSIILFVGTANEETISYVIDKEKKVLVNTIRLNSDYFNINQFFSSEKASVIFSSDIFEKIIRIYPLEGSESYLIDLSVFDPEENDFVFRRAYASYNEQGWLFCLLPFQFQDGISQYFYTLQLNQDMKLDQVRKFIWEENEQYKHLFFYYQPMSHSVAFVSKKTDLDEYYLIKINLSEEPKDLKMHIYPLQLPVNSGKEKLELSFLVLNDKVLAQLNQANEKLYRSVSLFYLSED